MLEYLSMIRQKNKMIDDLFSQRMMLEHNYEENVESIEEIDRQLVLLGVEVLSIDQTQNMLGTGAAMPLWEPYSTDTIRWTSRKLVTTYRGHQYEVQIIEGVPISGDSSLRKNYANVSYSAEGIYAGLTKAIIASATCYIEDSAIGAAVDFVGEKLNRGITVLNMLNAGAEEIRESLETSTILERVEGVAVISFTGHMKYVYVKPYGTTDANYQGLYYYGNSVSCLITTVSVVDVLVDGELVTYHSVSTTVQDTVQSLYYDDYSKAVANYYDRNFNNNMDFKQNYTVRGMPLSIFNHTDHYYLPWATHPGINYD